MDVSVSRGMRVSSSHFLFLVLVLGSRFPPRPNISTSNYIHCDYVVPTPQRCKYLPSICVSTSIFPPPLEQVPGLDGREGRREENVDVNLQSRQSAIPNPNSELHITPSSMLPSTT
ncbi:hypothetical protein V8F06_002129 [Rhypophila decipiens]